MTESFLRLVLEESKKRGSLSVKIITFDDDILNRCNESGWNILAESALLSISVPPFELVCNDCVSSFK